MIHSSFTWLLEINLACYASICQLAGIFLAVLYPREAFHQSPPLHHGPVAVLSEFTFVVCKNRGLDWGGKCGPEDGGS